MTERIFELWVGAQQSGKTFQFKRRALALAERPTVHCVGIVDRIGEYSDVGTVYRSPGELADDSRETLPRIAVCQWGIEAEKYEYLFELFEHEGNCALLLDEARDVAPAGSAWRGSERLRRIALQGRHLPNLAGKLCPTHVLAALQHPKGLHITLREQASTVMIGRLHGDNAVRWVQQEFGADVRDRVLKLGPHEWTCALGKDPR